MEIYFDRKTLAILRRIHHSGDCGTTWSELQKKFGDDVANTMLLINLSQQLYTATQDNKGNWLDERNWIHLGPSVPVQISDGFRSFCTPKGNELLERRSFDFWKWVIPTLISVVALVVSFIGVL